VISRQSYTTGRLTRRGAIIDNDTVPPTFRVDHNRDAAPVKHKRRNERTRPIAGKWRRRRGSFSFKQKILPAIHSTATLAALPGPSRPAAAIAHHASASNAGYSGSPMPAGAGLRRRLLAAEAGQQVAVQLNL